jgi:hypothetical protein
VRTSHTGFAARLGVGAALAMFGVLALSQTAFAYESGTFGHYAVQDSAGTSGATCKYVQDTGNPSLYTIYKITVPAPSVWWPNRNSTSKTEHGKVGWQLQVLYDYGGPGYPLFAKSPVQKAVAYEDQTTPYGSTTKAPFTKMTVTFNGKSQVDAVGWLALVKMIWYRTDGRVLGYVTQVIQNYREKQVNGYQAVQIECSPQYSFD